MHPTLVRHLREHFGSETAVPDGVGPFLASVDATLKELTLAAASAAESGASAGTSGIASVVLQRVPAIIYAVEFGPVARCHYASPQIRTILGFEPDDWLTNPTFWLEQLHPDDRALAIDAALRAQRTGQPIGIEYRMLSREGRVVWIRDEGVVVPDEHGRPAMLQGLMYDITERKHAEQKLLHEATHDSLTGLPNRTLLIDRIQHSVARSVREVEHRCAVLCVGLDRFKIVNESVGPSGGDELLIEFSRRLTRCVRPADTVARVGGDEFVLLCEGVATVEDANRIAERVQSELARPFHVHDMEVFATSSIGIAISRGAEDRAQDLLRDADIAMHHAKRDGKARHQVFDATMHAAVVQQLQVENDLRRAIDRGGNEFVVFYQPIVCVHTGAVVSVEALVRWQHPERGMVPPMEFIPVAEETGLIAPIERIVLAQACAQVAEWNRLYGARQAISVSVNLSARRFLQHDLVDEILRIVVPSGLPTDLLKLEITETVIMNDRDRAAQMLAELKRMNIHISLDDFGTGYSSLSYLHRFPIDTVKIDRSFVKMIDTPGEGDQIVGTIVSLAHHLNMSVTAEGVETERQLERLRELGCEFGQGYYFSKPVDAKAFEQVLLRRSGKRAAA